MKKIVGLLSVIMSIILLTGCLKDNISDDLQGEWRLLGWDVDGYFHEVDSFKVEYHKFSVEFSGNNVKAYSLGNVTDFGRVRSKNNTLIKESVTQTEVLAIDDESIYFDKNIIMTVNDQQGTIKKDKYLRKWYIAYNYPGSDVTIIRYYPESFPDIEFLQEDLKVVFSGDAYNMDVNWGDYQSEKIAGMEYYCIDLLKIEKKE